MEIRDDIRVKIGEWYLGNKRDLPWRNIKDPYRIWVSEIILQQTRVNQGMEYYHRFMEKFPDLPGLAAADETEVLKVWEGLGYYSRARNLHAAAKKIYSEYQGEFPASYSGLLELQGIGPYTAAAVSSIAFGEPRAVVDGNVHRVLSRIFGIEEEPSGYSPSSRILEEAENLLDTGDPGTHNQAVMELGALVCKPSSPECISCPVQQYCRAFLENRIDELPLKSKASAKRVRYFNYMVIRNNEWIWLVQRRDKDIWQGLYEFPLIETSSILSPASVLKTAQWQNWFGNGTVPLGRTGPFKHMLSHQVIRAVFYTIPYNDSFKLNGFNKVSESELHRYPFHKLIRRYLDKLID